MNNITERDHELLSAYIDSMLTADEVQNLEVRLANEPKLQQELSILRQTIALVKALPERKAPRNFTLTQEMIGDIPTAKIKPIPEVPSKHVIQFPTVSLISAVASLIITLAGLGLLLTDSQPSSNETTAEERAGLTSNIFLEGGATIAVAEIPTQNQMSEVQSFESNSAGEDENFRQAATASVQRQAAIEGTSTSIADIILPVTKESRGTRAIPGEIIETGSRPAEAVFEDFAADIGESAVEDMATPILAPSGQDRDGGNNNIAPPSVLSRQSNEFGQQQGAGEFEEDAIEAFAIPSFTGAVIETNLPVTTHSPPIPSLSPLTQVASRQNEQEVGSLTLLATEANNTEKVFELVTEDSRSDEAIQSEGLQQDDFGRVLVAIGAILMIIASGSFLFYRHSNS